MTSDAGPYGALDERVAAVTREGLLRPGLPALSGALLDAVVTTTRADAGHLLLRRDEDVPLVTLARTGSADEPSPTVTDLAAAVATAAVPLQRDGHTGLPVLLDGQVLAVLVVQGAVDVQGMQPVLDQMGWALERARIWDGQVRRNQRLVSLQSLTGRLSTASTLAAVADLVLGVAMAQDGTCTAAFYELVEEAGPLRLAAGLGTYADAVGPEVAGAAAEEAAETGSVIVRRAMAGTLVAAPVMFDDAVFGALTVTHDAASVEEIDPVFVASLAEQAAAALKRARLHAGEQASLANLQLLTEASAVLGATLDADQILHRLLALLTAKFADSAVLRAIDHHGEWQVLGLRHSDPDLHEALADLIANRATTDAVLEAVVKQYAADDHVYIAEYPDADVVAATEDNPIRQELVRELDVCCAAVVPLSSSAGLEGALSLTHRRGSGRHFRPADEQMLRELGTKIGAALRNARVHAESREVAVTLQRSLLPQRIPELPGLEFAWRYLPGAAGVHIGGDWYDAIALEHGCVGVLIGDVMGRGVQAAAIMGQLRATARAYASAQRPPADVLRQLDIAVGGLEQGYITTALFGVLDPATGAFTVASAGHLPPLLLDPSGAADFLPVEPGPPLGAGPAQYPLVTTLAQGSTLLLFTDGLVENRLTPVDTGMERLRAAVAGVAGASPDAVCERALVSLGRDREYEDDTALLAVTLTGLPQGRAGDVWSWQLPERADAVGVARGGLREALAAWTVPPTVVDDVLLVATELASNALLHVGGDVVVTARRGPGDIRLEVRDTAPHRQPLVSLTTLTRTAGRHDDEELDRLILALEEENTTGRGLSIVGQLATAWGCDVDETGKTVWAVCALPDARAAAAPAPGTGIQVRLTRVPVRLILASAANLDEMVREFRTGDTDRIADLGEEGGRLLERTARTREPFRVAARNALARGRRLVDVKSVATPESVAALARFSEVMDLMVAQCREGRLLALSPPEEVVQFRRWYVAEIGRQFAGAAPTPCPFPDLL